MPPLKPSRPPEAEDRAPKVVPGPWEIKTPKPPRQPIFKRSGRTGVPIINSWRGLLVLGLLLFVAPPVIGFVARLILGLMQGAS
jgi:hypothetical protein